MVNYSNSFAACTPAFKPRANASLSNLCVQSATISRLANALGVNANELTADASIRVNSAPEMVELQQKVAAGQATEQEKQAWLEANLKGLERMQHSIEFMLHDLAQYDETKKIARQSRLTTIFNQLTEDGQEKALDFLEIMLGNPKYKK